MYAVVWCGVQEAAKCPGGSLVQECAPFKKLTVPGNLFWAKLGKCAYKGTPYTCPVPKGRGCYSCVLCKTNNKIEAKVFTGTVQALARSTLLRTPLLTPSTRCLSLLRVAPADYCTPTATPEGIYVGPSATTTPTTTTTTAPKPTTTNGAR